MAKHYHSDVARWEGEGGASDEAAVFTQPATQAAIRDRKIRNGALWQIVCSMVILIGSALYARQKGWI
jgi:hypothetical protein